MKEKIKQTLMKMTIIIIIPLFLQNIKSEFSVLTAK
jgi:hypothetical protein